MKKIFLAIVAVFCMSTVANAQIQDLGVRFGGGQGYGAELSTMWGMGGNRLEVDLGFSSGNHHTDFLLSGIYQWAHLPIVGNLTWYAGVGAQLGYWSWESGYSNKSDSDIMLAVAGQVGLEYDFSRIPFQVTLDIRPRFEIIPSTNFHWGDIALGIRYRF